MGAHAGPLHVLLVDDAAELRMLLRSLLAERPNVVVEECDCGEAAVQQVTVRRPDLVVMDHNMPGMNGVAATRAIRAIHPDLEVVAFTAVDGHEREFAEAGASAHFLKDRFNDLVAFIGARAGGSRAAA